MSDNTFGKIYSFTTFGESHGEALGTVIDGMPSGVQVDYDFLLSEMARRRPGQSLISTQRNEEDRPRILSGVFEGKTTGTPIAVIVENSPFVLLFPAFFMEFFHTMDDYYQNAKNSTYMRIIRIISFVISTMLPGIYISLITYNHEIIPPGLLVNFAIQKHGVPFPTIIEALVLTVTFEILRLGY